MGAASPWRTGVRAAQGGAPLPPSLVWGPLPPAMPALLGAGSCGCQFRSGGYASRHSKFLRLLRSRVPGLRSPAGGDDGRHSRGQCGGRGALAVWPRSLAAAAPTGTATRPGRTPAARAWAEAPTGLRGSSGLKELVTSLAAEGHGHRRTAGGPAPARSRANPTWNRVRGRRGRVGLSELRADRQALRGLPRRAAGVPGSLHEGAWLCWVSSGLSAFVHTCDSSVGDSGKATDLTSVCACGGAGVPATGTPAGSAQLPVHLAPALGLFTCW